MMHPALALQEAIFAALDSSQGLSDHLGENRIFDDVPRGMRPPYIVFSDMTHTDWSTGTEDGMEHFVTLNIWSRENGRKQVLELANIVVEELTTLPASLSDHALVNLQHDFTETAKDDDTGYFRASVNLRAVTEPSQSNQL